MGVVDVQTPSPARATLNVVVLLIAVLALFGTRVFRERDRWRHGSFVVLSLLASGLIVTIIPVLKSLGSEIRGYLYDVAASGGVMGPNGYDLLFVVLIAGAIWLYVSRPGWGTFAILTVVLTGFWSLAIGQRILEWVITVLGVHTFNLLLA